MLAKSHWRHMVRDAIATQKRWANAGLTLANRRERWTNITPIKAIRDTIS